MLRVSPHQVRWTNEDGDRVALLRDHAERLAPPQSRDFAEAFDRFGTAKLVLLGEATMVRLNFTVPVPRSAVSSSRNMGSRSSRWKPIGRMPHS